MPQEIDQKRLFEVEESESAINIRNVPIMQAGNDVKGLTVDETWFDEAIKIFKTQKNEGYLPTVFVGHNNGVEEKPAKGFIGDLKTDGKRLYADILDVKDRSILRDFPYRSVEIPAPEFKRVSGLALLGSNAPFFKLPAVFSETSEGVETMELIYKFNQNNMPKQSKLFEEEEKKEEEAPQEESKEETPAEEVPAEEAPAEEVVAPAEEVPAEEESVEASESNVSKSLKSENDLLRATLLETKKTADKAAHKLLEMELTEDVRGITLSEANKEGKVLPKNSAKLVTFLASISAPKRKMFMDIINDQPSLGHLFEEKGYGGDIGFSSVPADMTKEDFELDLKIKKLMADKNISYNEAYDLQV